MSSLLGKTIFSAAEGLQSGTFTSVELTRAYLGQIRGMNNILNAYLTVMDEEALEWAREADERRAKGEER